MNYIKIIELSVVDFEDGNIAWNQYDTIESNDFDCLHDLLDNDYFELYHWEEIADNTYLCYNGEIEFIMIEV